MAEKFNLTKCQADYREKLTLAITYNSTKTQNENNAIFKKWGELLITGLIGKLAEFNPALHAYSANIETLQQNIRQLRSQKDRIEDQLIRINNLMEFKEAQQ